MLKTMGFLFRLSFFAGLIAIVSFAIWDDPVPVYKDAFDDAKCAVNGDWCPYEDVALRQVVPGVNVYFVDPSLAQREGRNVAILADDWPYCDDETGDVFLTPAFFETDFASIPSFAQWYIDPSDPKVIGGAIIHDWLYALGGIPAEEAKARADKIFRWELKQAGVNVIKRNIMYQAVARFGGKTFGDDVEMRFRNPETGVAFTQPRPDNPVIDNVGPGCDTFLDDHWYNTDRPNFAAHYLNPLLIQDWIELPGDFDEPSEDDDEPIRLIIPEGGLRIVD
ncbi:MAG: DUF1353 domain-containing protein [Pseudomonadota bacterium]